MLHDRASSSKAIQLCQIRKGPYFLLLFVILSLSLSLSLSFPTLFALLVLFLEFSVKTEIDYARYFQIFGAASISSAIFKYQKKAFPETKEGRYF